MEPTTSGNPILANLFGLNLWANLALIDACAGLDVAKLDKAAAGLPGTMRAALWQMIEDEHRVVAALDGDMNAGLGTLAGGPDGDLSTLRVHAIDTGEGLVAWAEGITGDPMLRGDWDGTPYHAPASVLAAQALLRSQELRSRALLLLTEAGVEPPTLSAWAWWDSLNAAGMEHATI